MVLQYSGCRSSHSALSTFPQTCTPQTHFLGECVIRQNLHQCQDNITATAWTIGVLSKIFRFRLWPIAGFPREATKINGKVWRSLFSASPLLRFLRFKLIAASKDGFPRKAKKFNGKVRRFAPHFTVLS